MLLFPLLLQCPHVNLPEHFIQFPLLQISDYLLILTLKLSSKSLSTPLSDSFALYSLFPFFPISVFYSIISFPLFFTQTVLFSFLKQWVKFESSPHQTHRASGRKHSISESDNQITLIRWFISNMVNPHLEASLVFLSQFLVPVFGTSTLTLFQPQGPKWLL